MLFGNGLRSASIVLLLSLLAPLAWAEPTVTLNLKDADIRTLIETVAKATGKNFIIDRKVKANVTVISSRPMEKDELYQVFLSILNVHGYSAVQVGDIIKIVPDVNAKQQPVPTASRSNPGTGDQLVTRVIQVNHIPAAQLVPILRPLVPQQGQLAAYPATNILLISDRAANIDRLASIVRRIDRADNEEIEVIALRHAAASEVVRIINSLQQKDQKGAPIPGQPVLAADERTNSILLSGDKSARIRIRGIIAHLDTPLESGGNTQVVFLRYAKAEDLAPILQGIVKGSGAKAAATGKAKAAPAVQQGDTTIQADETNNALIITAPSALQRDLMSIIRQLDIRRAQVLVEGILAEVSTDLSTEFGIQMAVDGSGADDQGPVGLTNFGGPGSSIVSLVNDPTSIGLGLSLGIADLTEGAVNFGVLLRALSGDAATNILSTPSLVTLDNEEAEFVVAQEVPFVTGSFTSTSSGGSTNPDNPFQTIERKDVGITLKIKPQINQGDTVKLEIDLESSQLAASSEGAVDLITNRRAVTTSVLVDDGNAVILSGLIEDRFTDSESKVPLLGDIPVLGHLFKYTTTGKAKANLMIFIHPVILRDAETSRAYTRAKYDYLRGRQEEADIEDRGVLRRDVKTLPDMRELITQLPPPAGDGEGPQDNGSAPAAADEP